MIRNGGAEAYLAAIEHVKGHPVIYRYTENIAEALWLTYEDAVELARKRHAVALWFP